MAALVYMLMAVSAFADTHYVSATRPDDSGNGLSWATAEKTIQAAVTAATAGDTIIVTNGVYGPISTANKAITIQSVNGVAVTVIDGGGTNRCATLGSSSSHTNTVLVGFTLQKGYASSGSGGGSYYGTLNNCTLSGNSATSDGGGSFYGTLNNCILSENSAFSSGGGAYYGTLNNCTLSVNSACFSGGGSYYGTLNNCTLSGNSASWGGGSYNGTLNNCMLSGNSSFSDGGGSYGGTLNNCTLVRNSASFGGGAYSGTLNNCIVWGNTLNSGVANNYNSSTFRYSCTSPLPSGTGNISVDPLFRLPVAEDLRLSPGSPCINAGTNDYAVGTVDGYGNPRIQNGTVDMGAYEGEGALAADSSATARTVTATGGAEGVTVSWAPPQAGGAVLYRVCRMNTDTGLWIPVSGWISGLNFLDTRVFFGETYRYAILSAFDVQLNVISLLSEPSDGQRTVPQFYVNASRPSDAGDGRSWATAKRTIQGAISLSTPYDTILVTNGVYAPISTANKVVTIRSVNGAAVTIIDGGGSNRCATLGTASSHIFSHLVGFTLQSGYASDGGGSYAGMLDNCSLIGNTAQSFGGGAINGKLNNCTLTRNSAPSGGGAYDSALNICTLLGNSATFGGGSYNCTLNSCTLSGNIASSTTVSTRGGGSCNGTLNNCKLDRNSAFDGGGSYNGTMSNCTLSCNSASWGGGSNNGTLNNCTLSGNSASSWGGGSCYGTLNNCTFSGNSASMGGGGSYYGILNNCTLAGNSASSGGGAYNGTLNNCIVWGNTLGSGETNNYYISTFMYSCTTPLPSGTGNLSADPLFRLPAAEDLRLSPGSPCINAGTNGYAVGSVDGYGNPRVQNGTVDMGAYEGEGSSVADSLAAARTVTAAGGAQGVTVSWVPPQSGGAVLYRVCRMNTDTGLWMPVSDWISGLSFLDTRVLFGVTYRYAILSAFDVQLNVISALSEPAEGQRALPQLYVDALRPGDTGDGRSWATAKRTIQGAISLSTPYDTIFVTNGVYAPILTPNKMVAIRSVNGAAVTIIDGGWTNRCATLGTVISQFHSLLAGFSLKRGYASDGGGSYAGTLTNCTLIGNIASSYGGGAYYSTLHNCLLYDNSASFDGGGVYVGKLKNCTLSGNSASSGGASCYGTLNNCTLRGNRANSGGGSYGGELSNCTLSGNGASFGGGSYGGTLNNCTLTGNNASSGGGIWDGILKNCIVWGNTLFNGVTNNYAYGTFNNSCTTPLPSGVGNISRAPLFRLQVAGDFRLSQDSPCLNAGTNVNMAGTVDLLGNTRIQDGIIDMGAYEGGGGVEMTASRLAHNVLAIGLTDGIDVSWEPPSDGGAVLYRVCRIDVDTGEWTPISDWITELRFMDEHVYCGVTYRYAILSAFDDELKVISGLSETAEGKRSVPQLYVDASRLNNAGDGRSWSTAKKTIQAAISVSSLYDTILVTNGVYAPFSTENRAIAIRSVNGSSSTVIDGGGTNRCATMGSLSSHLRTILDGFFLRNGYANTYGGGAYFGTLDNCTLSGNSASYGGGSYYCKLNNCILTGNKASTSGGGAYYGTVNNCVLTGNSASTSGGGAYNVTLNNCVLTGNNASSSGGGTYNGTLNNCTLFGNKASSGGGACESQLNNCSLFGNSAFSGGGSQSGTLNNSIVWSNFVFSGRTDNYSGGTFNYSCTTPLPGGSGNICVDPLFRLPAAGDFRLQPGSPCLNAGSNGYVVGVLDGIGNPRIQEGTVDMGACEGTWVIATNLINLAQNVSAVGGTNGVLISWELPSAGGAVFYQVCRMDEVTGQWTPISGWIKELNFLDTRVFSGAPQLYVVVTAFDNRLDTISGLSASAEGQRTLIPQLYVDAARQDNGGDGRSWMTAKKTIQAAIGASMPYDTILVTNGVYGSISTANREIKIQSVNGADATVIDGGGTNRCATLGSSFADLNTTVIGFTLRNGFSMHGGGSYFGKLNNCILLGNNVSYNGGGAYYGMLKNCSFIGNHATSGGGAYYSTLDNCMLSGNSATSGGGSYYGVLNNCTLLRNTATYGGGSYEGTLNNSTLTGNNASSYGGGSYGGTLNNCTLTGNNASSYGGGSYYGGLNNCTLFGNIASLSCGGSYGGALRNCIIWGNTLASGVTNNYSFGTINYSCTMPLQSGTGNISSNPLFHDASNSNFMLKAESPCINAGSNAFVVGTTDLAGNPRIVAGRVDMGAYEMPPTVTVTFDANGGLLATGQAVTNLLGFAGDPYDSWLTLSNGMSRTGYTFTGWFTAASGGEPVFSNHTISAGRIYAQWMSNSYTVTLDWQNGLDVTLTNVLYGQAYQLAPAVYADATFFGWWTLPNGMGACILPETLVSVASNHMLYAQWDVNSVVGSTGLVWQTAGDSLWFVQTNAMTQGLTAMRSGVISADQTSWIGTSVTGAGRFSFWWRVSSEGAYDVLSFAVDGVHNRVISGTKKDEWQLVEVAFTNAGAHELRWTYSKDDSVSEGLDCGWLDRVAWIPARPVIPGNPNVSSNFLNNVIQVQVDALVAGLRAAHPDVTDGEIAKKFEDAELFGFTGVALVGVGTDALARFNPSITLATLSVSEGDSRTLVVTVTIGNNIDPTPAEALARIGEAISSLMRGVFKNSLSAGASETILAPALSLDNATGVVTATFTLENPSAPSGFLRMSLRR